MGWWSQLAFIIWVQVQFSPHKGTHHRWFRWAVVTCVCFLVHLLCEHRQKSRDRLKQVTYSVRSNISVTRILLWARVSTVGESIIKWIAFVFVCLLGHCVLSWVAFRLQKTYCRSFLRRTEFDSCFQWGFLHVRCAVKKFVVQRRISYVTLAMTCWINRVLAGWYLSQAQTVRL